MSRFFWLTGDRGARAARLLLRIRARAAGPGDPLRPGVPTAGWRTSQGDQAIPDLARLSNKVTRAGRGLRPRRATSPALQATGLARPPMSRISSVGPPDHAAQHCHPGGVFVKTIVITGWYGPASAVRSAQVYLERGGPGLWSSAPTGRRVRPFLTAGAPPGRRRPRLLHPSRPRTHQREHSS